LGKKVQRVCVAYPNMDHYFPKDKVVITGNPVRRDILDVDSKRDQSRIHFGLNQHGKTLLVLGGSLGARTINESILSGLDALVDAQVQVVWQTGKIYFEEVKRRVANRDLKNIHVHDFLKSMDLAYACSDVVISRAGALSISEISLAQKACILVPSPNVAEDHQTKNAMALSSENAAVAIRDAEAGNVLVGEALKLIYDDQRCASLKENIGRFGKPRAAEEIVNEIEKLIVA
jgi:UDP-N-acetylglucosamine--N-acetylmuramyl-(pentapeptide) pyrophosphoryl-undecaprenol N-acetylglucosamine transferase